MKKTKKTLRHMAMAAGAGALALAATMVSAGAAQADPMASMDEPGVLQQGDRLSSDDTSLIMQGDGNLVLYRGTNTAYPYPVWVAPNTLGCGIKAIMQGDGNFVVYGVNAKVCWASGTKKSNPAGTASLVVANKGGLAICFTNPPSHGLEWASLRSSDLY
ncbi:hypothetical protein ACFVXG_07960 [Kitasatospora sp. NPDC058162]|uniref:hypothetical protein n=1 Tax=Kitasatospora sp. NPDC058162 TaxID=3346362 RepID=UPI0036D79759